MPKLKTQYVCQQCGRIAAREMGRCPQCEAWNSMVEEVVAPPSAAAGRAASGAVGRSTPRRLAEIGDRAAAVQIKPEHLPAAFDLPVK